MIQQHLKSKTISWGWLFGGLQAVNAQVHLLQPVVDAQAFAYISLALAFINASGAHLIRTKTNKSLSEK